MKWFKHMSDASDDEFLEELEELFGLEAYARWWKLCEAISKQMGDAGKCSATYSWTKWQTILKGKRNKLETFLVHCQNKQKLFLKQTENVLEIGIPKLLELRDNHSKRSVVTTPLEEEEVEAEREEESIKEIKIQKIEPIQKPKEPKNAGTKRHLKPSTLLKDWYAEQQLSEFPNEWRVYATGEGWPATRIDNEAKKFWLYWTSDDCKAPKKRDWFRTWQNWCANARADYSANKVGFNSLPLDEQDERISNYMAKRKASFQGNGS